MKPRFLPIFLTLCPLVFNQSAFAYDDHAQQQIQQIEQQLEQQFPQQIQSNQPRSLNQGMFNQGMSQSADAQQQIMQINQRLQQMTQPQQFQQLPVQMTARPQMQQAQQMQQEQMQASPAQPMQQNQTAGFAPSNSQTLNLPVLNSTISGYTSVNDVVPNAVGATYGVDILDESLKFHSQVNGQASPRPMPTNTNQNFNVGVAANRTCNHDTVSSVNSGSSCCQHSQNQGSSGSNGDSFANGGGQISTRAIGALGAAALVGTFLGNGGVGGVIKSVGWDNSRHTRGMSIGGY